MFIKLSIFYIKFNLQCGDGTYTIASFLNLKRYSQQKLNQTKNNWTDFFLGGGGINAKNYSFSMTNCVKILTTMLVSTCIWLIQQVDKKEIQVTADQVKLAFKYHTQSCIVYHKIYSTYVTSQTKTNIHCTYNINKLYKYIV